MDAGLRIIAGADQSSANLRRRLAYRGYTEPAIEAAIAQLVDFGYVNEEKLSKSITARKLRDGYGRRRIASDLRGRGVDSAAVEVAMAGIDGDEEISSCTAAIERWQRTHHGAFDRAQRTRLGAWLQRRGFGFDVISKCMNEMSQEAH